MFKHIRFIVVYQKKTSLLSEPRKQTWLIILISTDIHLDKVRKRSWSWAVYTDEEQSKYTEIRTHQIYFLFFGFCAKNVGAGKWFKNVNFFSFFCLCHFWWAKRKILCGKYISYIFHVFSDHILILNILFFNKLRQIIPEVRSEMRDLLISIFILKTTGTFTPVHSAGYLILRNEFRSTHEVARQNIQVSFYIRSMGLWPNTWIHVSQ